MDPSKTIKEAKDHLKAMTEKGKYATCPCCSQRVAIYKRRINANAARALILLLNKSELKPEEIAFGIGFHPPFLHIQQIFSDYGLRATAMDYIQLARFGLIEKSKEKAPEDKKDSGMWKLTFKGYSFAMGNITIPEHVIVYDNKSIAWSEKQVTILECLKKKFKYSDIIDYGYISYSRVRETV